MRLAVTAETFLRRLRGEDDGLVVLDDPEYALFHMLAACPRARLVARDAAGALGGRRYELVLPHNRVATFCALERRRDGTFTAVAFSERRAWLVSALCGPEPPRDWSRGGKIVSRAQATQLLH